MKLLKPSWVHHDDNSIFSIDVHPDNSRFATGGQGSDSGRIIIWNMAPVVDEQKENDSNSPKMLCQMDHHIACVNVVRWSNNGLFLASGSDDKLVMIWHYAQGGMSGMSFQNIENWKCGHTLRGHSGDVMDLAWSAKDQYLATCSVDNTIIIWNALKFPDIISRINAHAGLVKGVAWDPVGTYFASQSDDKTLKIWRTLDWSLEKSVDEPFKQCTGTTHVLRLNWSPDGQLILSAHAMNNGAPTAQVIERNNKWRTNLDFVGHRKAVTTVRFFPKILKSDAKTSDAKSHCLCALGSRDRSISIWLTSYKRPLCVIHSLFDNPIMDLSWCTLPKPGLLACSMDGTVAFIEFDYQEIGYPLSKTETEDFFMKKYNCDISASIALKQTNLNQQNTQSQQKNQAKKDESIKFIENLDILMAQEEKQLEQDNLIFTVNENTQSSQQSHLTKFDSQSQFQQTPSKLHPLTQNHKQIERRMPDGRRRITPICVCKPGEYDAPKPFGSQQPNFNDVGFEKSIGFGSPTADVKITSKTATEQSTIIVEKRDEKNEIVEISPVKSILYSKPTNLASANFHTNSSNDQLITRPVLNTEPSKNNEALAQLKLQTNETMSQKPQQVASLNQQSQTKISTSQSTPLTSKPGKPIVNNKANLIDVNKTPTMQSNKPKPSVVSRINPTPTTTSNNVNNNISQIPQQQTNNNEFSSRKSELANSKSSHSQESSIVYLAPLKMDKNFITRNVSEKTSTKSAVSIEVHNSVCLMEKGQPTPFTLGATQIADCQLSLLKYFVDFKLKWQIFLMHQISEVTCSNDFVCVACADSTVHLFKTNNGVQICCPILVDSKAAALKSNGNYCLCLSTTGFLYVWKFSNEQFNNTKCDQSDFNQLRTVINRQSCHSILRDGIFLNAFLTENGTPVIYMSKNRSYFYSTQTQCWHLIPSIGNLIGEDVQLLINSSSVYSGHAKAVKQNDPAVIGPLSLIQSRDKGSNILKTIEMMNKACLNENSLFNRQDFTLTHLESQMNAAMGLASAKEYKFWLITYARYLIENNYENKLGDLCHFLLGPPYSLNWTSTILTFKKRDLLKEILPIMAQNLSFQRLYSYYKQQLSLVSDSNSHKSVGVLSRLTNNENPEASKFMDSQNLARQSQIESRLNGDLLKQKQQLSEKFGENQKTENFNKATDTKNIEPSLNEVNNQCENLNIEKDEVEMDKTMEIIELNEHDDNNQIENEEKFNHENNKNNNAKNEDNQPKPSENLMSFE